jgi:hypothetical protein
MIWSDQYNRLVPQLGPERYKSYSMRMPLSTHFKPATCAEFECDAYRFGFVVTIDTSMELGERRYHYVTHDKTRRYSMQRVGPTLFKFIYGPGNDGMGLEHGEHRMSLDRPAFLLVAEGDFRGNPRGTPVYVHRYQQDWVDDFATHQDRLATALQRG